MMRDDEKRQDQTQDQGRGAEVKKPARGRAATTKKDFFFFSLSRRLSSTNKALGPIVAVITGKALSQPQALSANDDKSICETLLGQPYSGTSRGTGQGGRLQGKPVA